MMASKYVYTDPDEIEILVSKHGSHDQKTHGSWANALIGTQTLLGTTVTSLIDKLSEKNTPGFSIDLRTKTSPKDGFIASDKGAERALNWAEVSSSRTSLRNEIIDYVVDHAELLDSAGTFFGGWIDEGVLYLDVSRRYASRSEGIRVGFQNEQKAIYDVVNDSYIYMEDEVDERTNKARSSRSSETSQGNDPTGIGSLRRRDGGSPTGQREESPHVCLGRYQGVEKHLEGQHDQATHGSWASGRFGADSVKSARDGAKEYAFKAGIEQDDSIDYQKTVANRARAGRIADAYDELPTVQEEAFPSYTALATEVEAQFDYMTKTLGIKVEFVADDPYKTSREMFADVSKGVLKVLSTASTGSHPFFKDEQNDKFRAVHDFFGHAATGRGFGQDGEESAWVHHSQMFTETARGALTTETRGQNSWYNTRGQGFAEQKVALLPKEFWEVPKTFEKQYKVIKFQAGLIPIFKHGTGDQKPHGSWATGRGEEDVKRISRMKNLGPSLEELDNAMSGENSEIDRDKAKMMIDNDENANSEIESRIYDLIATLEEQEGTEISEYDKMTNWDSWRSQVMEEYISENADNLEQYARENGYGSLKDPQVSQALVESFQEVYGVEITSDRKGDPITLRSKVEEVYVDGEGIHVISNVFDDYDNTVNESEVHRIFSKNEDSGTWSVEHKLLELEEDYRGLGFGGKFLQQSEDWYISQGVTHIVLNAGLEDGARHWANAGFDWNSDELPFIADVLERAIVSAQRRIETDNSGLMSVSATKHRGGLQEARALLGRMRDGQGNIKDMKNDDFPKPADFARLGAKSPLVTEDGGSTWTGKELLRGLYVPYIKVLTAEGSNLLAGPIDMDGDGLIYDGTPREKPAPSSGNK